MSTSPLPFPHAPSPSVGPVVPLPAGVRIDRFIVEQSLHQGPHGFAYRVRESGHQQPLVLLECFPRALAIRQPDGAVRARQAGDAIALSVVCEAFVQDARALAAIDHPGVVKVYGVLNANRTVYRLMPYIEGRTLEEQRLEREEPPTVGGLVRLYDKLLDALEALHKAGFVHGAVQPDQILMRSDDNAPVLLGMDGVAMELGEVAMSPWAAPEQQQTLRYERVNASADLYMAAATMYFAATGAAPPRAEERLAGDAWDPTAQLAGLTLGGGDSPELRDNFIQALGASLALAAAARPQRADDVRHMLHPNELGGFVVTTGSAPLWVGEVPDRDSQWETLRETSGPVPLREEPSDEAETRLFFDPEPEPPAPAAPASAAAVAAAPAWAAAAAAVPEPAAAGGLSDPFARAGETGFHAPLAPADEPAGAPVAWPDEAGQPGDPIVAALPVRDEPRAPEPVVPALQRAPAGRRSPPRWQWAALGGATLLLSALALWWAVRPSPLGNLPGLQVPAAPVAPQAATPSLPVVPKATAAAPVVAAPAPPLAVERASPPPSAPSVVSAPVVAATPPAAPPAAITPTEPVSAAPVPVPVPAPRPSAAPAAPRQSAAVAPAPKVAAKGAVKTGSARSNGSKGATRAPERSAGPAPAKPGAARAAAAPARTSSTDPLCANRTQFAYLYCMQELCGRAANRANAQCSALRRSGDIR